MFISTSPMPSLARSPCRPPHIYTTSIALYTSVQPADLANCTSSAMISQLVVLNRAAEAQP